MIQGGLVLLALRRTLPPRLALVLAALAIGCTTVDWGPSRAVLDAAGDDAPARAFARQGVWLTLLAVGVPLVLARACATLPRWRAVEADWLAPRGVRRRTLCVSTFLGTWGAGLLLAFATVCAAEAAAPGSARTSRITGVLHHAPVVLHAHHLEARLPLTAEAGAILRVPTSVGPAGGRSARLVLDLVPAGAAPTAPARQLAGRSHQRLEVPAGDGPWELLIRRVAGDAEARGIVVVPDDSIEVHVDGVAEGRASVTLGLRLALLLAAWSALGLGLGAVVRGPIAALLVGVGWLAPWLWGRGTAWLPGGDLFRALDVLGDGVVPAPVDARVWGVTAALVLLGLAGMERGLARWRNG